MANFLLTQTGEEVQTILNEAPETKEGLQQEVNNREQAITAEQQATQRWRLAPQPSTSIGMQLHKARPHRSM